MISWIQRQFCKHEFMRKTADCNENRAERPYKAVCHPICAKCGCYRRIKCKKRKD